MKRIAVFVAGALLTALPAFAHHAFSLEYDWKKPVTITGTVERITWGSPHTMLMVNGKDEKGTSGTWTVELGSSGDLSHHGWTEKTLKAGEKVTVDGWGATRGGMKVNAMSVKTADGRDMFAASSFFHMEDQASAAKPAGAKATTGTSSAAPTDKR